MARSPFPGARRRDRRLLLGALGAAGFVAGARAARQPSVTRAEQQWFTRINGLPAEGHLPVWAVMQIGSLAGPLAGGVAVAASGRRALGARLALAGVATWSIARYVKRFVRRGRPQAALEVARVLGRAQSGLGYPSGHAAVAATLATVAVPALPRRWRPVAWLIALVTGGARVYVGAHLPLDVAGGVGLGVAVGAAVRQPVSGRG